MTMPPHWPARPEYARCRGGEADHHRHNSAYHEDVVAVGVDLQATGRVRVEISRVNKTIMPTVSIFPAIMHEMSLFIP